MTQQEDRPFIPPAPRPSCEIWQASYQLNRRDFLDAVEVAAQKVRHPIEGLHWEYEGFRGRRLYVCQPADPSRYLPYVAFEFGLNVTESRVTIYTVTSCTEEIKFFRQLTSALDEIRHVYGARLTPCSYVGMRPPIYSQEWA